VSASPKWPAWVLVAILATVVANNAFDYSVLVPQQPLRYQMHEAIVAGTAPAPQRFRILVPFALDPIIKAASTMMAPDQAFRRTYLVFHFAALVALLFGVYAYSRQWFTRDQSLIGTLIVGSTLHLALRMGEYWDFSPIPESSVFTPGSLLTPTVVAAALILINRAGEKKWTAAAAIATLWLVFTVIVRLWIGGSEWAWPAVTWQENLQHLPSVLINLALFMGPAILLAVTGYRRAPAFARQALVAAIPFLMAFAAFGYWWDVTQLMALYPLIAPVILASLFEHNA
jgi:hypothetical protein